ncbi:MULTISPECIES: hypothetical protein [unclassified Nocardia]|uniref:hypothetical protein n=1 Tax=unclassified Nocardia TaxID=2637762 RepID=UPI0035D7DAAF
MKDDEIIAAVRHILFNDIIFPAAEERDYKIDLDDGLQPIHHLDEIAFTELREQVGKRFGIDIPEDDWKPENNSSVRRIVAYVSRRLRT